MDRKLSGLKGLHRRRAGGEKELAPDLPNRGFENRNARRVLELVQLSLLSRRGQLLSRDPNLSSSFLGHPGGFHL